ncbi:hypothetical protein J7E82_12410 [Arthrobacter sp. ISL-30]|nr:hypothetical protein [Arthrobacter sp. ISL-30]
MVAVALWIVWVAPYVLRNGRQQFEAVGEAVGHAADYEPQESQAGSALMLAAQQEKSMDTSQSTSTGLDSKTTHDRHRDPAAAVAPLRVKYGRCTIALLGLVMLLAVPVTGILRIIGIGSIWLPIIGLAGAMGSILLLRRLALRDRRRRVSAAFTAAMTAPSAKPVAAPSSAPSADRREAKVFDAEAGKQAPPPPLCAFELRQAALAVAREAGDESALAESKSAAMAKDEAWEPVELPKPTYVDAAKAERPAPEPLDLPEAPKPVGKPSLKQGAMSTPGSQSVTGTPAAQPNIAAQSNGAAKTQSALSNLDDVLQRRRA